MCGIVGLYLKNPKLEPSLGDWLSAMLIELSDRGPDSAGVAFYRAPVPAGAVKLTLFHPDPAFRWGALADSIARDLGAKAELEPRASHGRLIVSAPYSAVAAWLEANHPDIRTMSAGDTIEIYKEMGLPSAVVERFGLREITGSHALGHTRMATESAVTTEHSHPFSTGFDLCLVHNGSLSNHNRLRQKLRRHGIRFGTDNDTEVAAGYLTWRMLEGDSLADALEASLTDLDGF